MAYRKIKIDKKNGKYFLLALGCALLLFEGYSATQAMRAHSWKKTTGSITSAHIARRSGYRRRGSGTLKLAYEYRVNGKKYDGHRVNFGGFGKYFTILSSFNPVLEEYSVGQSTAVYYDPQNPQDAVLERGFPQSAAIGFGVGVTFVIGAVMMIIAGRSESHDRERELEEAAHFHH